MAIAASNTLKVIEVFLVIRTVYDEPKILGSFRLQGSSADQLDNSVRQAYGLRLTWGAELQKRIQGRVLPCRLSPHSWDILQHLLTFGWRWFRIRIGFVIFQMNHKSLGRV